MNLNQQKEKERYLKMSKLSKAADKLKEVNSLRPEEIIINYMGGDSYVINPVDIKLLNIRIMKLV